MSFTRKLCIQKKEEALCDILSDTTPISTAATNHFDTNSSLSQSCATPHALWMRRLLLLVEAHVLHIL